MALPDSYTVKPNSVPAYFEAMLDAQAPERFTQGFLENLGFKSTNDRLWIKVLKDLGFLDQDGAPRDRYFEFLDRSKSAGVVAEGVREAFSDLFAVSTTANELTTNDVKNKLRTLYKGSKSDGLIDRIATTFAALCEYADFSASQRVKDSSGRAADEAAGGEGDGDGDRNKTPATEGRGDTRGMDSRARDSGTLNLGALQYHINIVLPESRDQAVYDAIFKSLRDHLGAQ